MGCFAAGDKLDEVVLHCFTKAISKHIQTDSKLICVLHKALLL